MRATSEVLQPVRVGAPVDWDYCLGCGAALGREEERYRIEKDGKIGVGHRQCQ